MTFITLLLALFAERFLLDQSEWRQAHWFRSYFRWISEQGFGAWVSAQYWGVLALLALPLMLTGWIQFALADWLWGLPSLLFSLLLLLYCLGPEDLDNQVTNYLEAEEKGDQVQAQALLECFSDSESALTKAGRVRQATDAVLVRAQERIFAVVLWFFLLGPLGALLYRLAWYLRGLAQQDEEGRDFRQGAERLLAILDWLPAHLAVFSYALAGDFDGALQGRRNWLDNSNEQQADEVKGLLVAAGNGALLLQPDVFDEETGTQPIEAALSLIWRCLTIWLAVAALLAMAL